MLVSRKIQNILFTCTGDPSHVSKRPMQGRPLRPWRCHWRSRPEGCCLRCRQTSQVEKCRLKAGHRQMSTVGCPAVRHSRLPSMRTFSAASAQPKLKNKRFFRTSFACAFLKSTSGIGVLQRGYVPLALSSMV